MPDYFSLSGIPAPSFLNSAVLLRKTNGVPILWNPADAAIKKGLVKLISGNLMLWFSDKECPARNEKGKNLLHEPARVGDFMDYTEAKCNINTPRIFERQRLRSGLMEPDAGTKSFLYDLFFQDLQHPLLDIHRDNLAVFSDTPRNGPGKEARAASGIKDRIARTDIPVNNPARLVFELSPPPVKVTGAGLPETLRDCRSLHLFSDFTGPSTPAAAPRRSPAREQPERGQLWLRATCSGRHGVGQD